MKQKASERGKTKNQNLLPKIAPLPGVLCLQKVRCGKPNCRCAKGLLHEGYYYRFYYINGKLYKKYVKKGDVERIKQACLQHKLDKLEMQLFLEEAKREWRMHRQLLRELGL